MNSFTGAREDVQTTVDADEPSRSHPVRRVSAATSIVDLTMAFPQQLR